jgi:hypothetical protein
MAEINFNAGITGSDLPGIPHDLPKNPLDRRPDSDNPLLASFFRFSLLRSPSLTYFCQATSLPGINIPSVIQPSVFTQIKHPGGRAEYADLSLNFIVDENLENWLEIHDWILNISSTYDFDHMLENAKDHYSDGMLAITNSSMNPKYIVKFYNMFPNSLSDLTFDSSDGDATPLISTVTFSYDYYEVERT